jgi:hypothetical protein
LEAAGHGGEGKADGTADRGEKQLHLMIYDELQAFVIKGHTTSRGD